MTSPSTTAWRGWVQYEVFISERMGKSVSVAIDMHADKAHFVDNGGIEQDFDAATFDRIMEPAGLVGKPKPCKRQLEMML